jgi:hypothetical protein
MKKVTLSETALFVKMVPDLSGINNEEIKKFSIKQIAEHSDKIDNYGEYPCSFNKHTSWLSWFIKNEMDAYHEINIEQLSEHLLKQDHNEITLKRKHIDFFSPKNTPDFTSIYFMDDASNKLVLEFNDHKYRNLSWEIPIEKGKCVVFNSDVSFYFSKNIEKEILTHYVIKWHHLK